MSLVPMPLSAPGDRGVLRGLLQRHAVAALPRRRRQAGVPPRVVGLLRHGQPALRRAGRRARRRGRDGLGARLPAAAGAGDAARAAARPADRLLPAHPVPAHRALRAAAVAPPDPRGAARRRPRRLPAPGGAQNFVRLVRQRVGHKTHRDLVYLPDGRTVRAAAFPISIDYEGFEELARSDAGRRARRGDPRAARQPAQGLPRRRPARLHQGHPRPAAGVRRAARRRALRRRGRGVRAGGDARPASASTSTACCATRSTGSSAGSTATSAGSVGRRSPTCTPPTPATRWPRSSGPPTSWSSPPTATA